MTQSANGDIERGEKTVPATSDDNASAAVTRLRVRRNGCQKLLGLIAHLGRVRPKRVACQVIGAGFTAAIIRRTMLVRGFRPAASMERTSESLRCTRRRRQALFAIFPERCAQMNARQAMRQRRRRLMVGAGALRAKLRGDHVGRVAVLRGLTDILALDELVPPTANG